MNTLRMLKLIFCTFLILITYEGAYGIDVGGLLGSWLSAYSAALSQGHPQPSGNTSHSKLKYIPELNFSTSEHSAVLKHELEDEYHPEETTTHKSTQEIDETKPDINCTFGGSSNAQDLQAINTNSNTNRSKNYEKEGIDRKVVPIHSKRITITNTYIKVATKYETIFPSCLKFDHVSRVCDGMLITLQPTPTATNSLRNSNRPTYEVIEDIDEFFPESKATVAPSNTRYGYKSVTAEPSDYDYEFESLELFHDAEGRTKVHEATPRLEDDNSIREEQFPRKVNRFHTPEYIIQSEVISVTKTMTTLDSYRTATVVASNCIPRDIHIPPCSQKPDYFPDIPIFPILAHP